MLMPPTDTSRQTSWLPPAGGNLFQTIKQKRAAAEAAGKKILKLSIGQPNGPALVSAREGASRAVMSNFESMHEYQDNGSPGVHHFARRFVQCHVLTDLSQIGADSMSFLPIPGIKPMLPLIPLACGASRTQSLSVMTTTDPGYPTPAYWCNVLPGVKHRAIKLSPDNNFLFNVDEFTGHSSVWPGDLIMMNYPHNPSGKAADREWLEKLCDYASANRIRIFNDAAYAILAHSSVHTSLADVAIKFPNLSWAEAYSASKAGNFTGWRIGAIAGSPDFVGDIARIKGDADSGFAAPMAAGVLDAFEHDMGSIVSVRHTYGTRIRLLTDALTAAGMRLAVEPDAGFFTLWHTPAQAFGVPVESSEHFHTMMIENTGIEGVYFHPYTRYSVTGNILEMLSEIKEGFAKAKVSY